MYNRHETRDCEIARLRDSGQGQWLVSSKRVKGILPFPSLATSRSCDLAI